MNNRDNSVASLVDRLQRKAPEYLDLLTAETQVDFENAFDALLEKAVMGLETNKKNFEALDEVGLSAALALALTIPGLSVAQETHSNGHVDLTITADHCTPVRKKLGEAKIYDGPRYHIAGINQLLGRYTTGRESRGLMIVYVRKRDIAGLIKRLRETMDVDMPCQQQGKTADHSLRWSFISTHYLSSGDSHEVSHIGCNLCTQ